MLKAATSKSTHANLLSHTSLLRGL